MKRLFDLVLLLPATPLFAGLTALAALVVLVADGRPILFAQERMGRFGRPFRIYKLRTMTLEPEPRDRRPTRVGAWLRARGIDELPQLWNVFIGDMSLVGPRPLSGDDYQRLVALHPRFAARLTVRPGLTGAAQVSGVTGVTATAEIEAAYARACGVRLDLAILARTLWMSVVGKRRGRWPAERLVEALAPQPQP
jgi:lipopolysaccharide/colanic/teichoic acid biosynthesis glycosyltransferase